jgi:hypothetical protein
MTVEKYIKAGIISGIILAGFTIVFGIIPGSMNNYQQYFVFPPDENSVKEKFLQSAEYQTFDKRFPDNTIDFSMTKYDAQFSASAANKETQNILVLSMSMNFNDYRIYKSAQCSALAMKSGIRYNSDNVMVMPFLETTTCLDSVKP